MQTNPKIFKAYDIRGVYGTDMNEQTAYKLGCAYVKLLSTDFKEQGVEDRVLNIGIAADMRQSSPRLKESLIAGILDMGANVIDLGMLSTPSFYFGVSKFNYDGGIIVSASHNPAEWNGFKMTRAKAVPISGETGMEDIKELVLNAEFTPVDQKGSLSKNLEVLEAQIKHDLSFAKPDKIKNFKVVADPANAMGKQYLDALFAELSCNYSAINNEFDGSFPAHEADPLKMENLEQLKKAVLEQGADLGIATDGDGDRVFFIDNEGELINPFIIRAILSKIFLAQKPGSKIAYDIRPGKITPDTILKYGGVPIVTRVGHSLIKEQAIAQGAYFAGESSGHFFLNMEDLGCFEVPCIVILELLQEFSSSEQSIADQVRPYRKYFNSGEINSVVSDKAAVLQKLEEKYSDGQINKLDGITIEYPNFWFNVRPSNTEEKLRLNLEAVDKETMEQKRDEVLGVIRT
jgi:phosphomannomutase